MTLSHELRRWIAVSTLALWGASLVVLYVGGFIQFDDTSGFGSNQWVRPLGLVAGLLAVAGVGVGTLDRVARRALGACLAVLDLLLVLLSITDDGFRFIWGDDEGELFFLQVILALAALFLLTPTFYAPSHTTGRDPRSPRSLSGWARFAVYVAGAVVAVFAAFFAGTAHFVATQCSGPNSGGECDIAFVEGFLWAGIALLLGLVAIVVAEVLRARRAER